MRCDSKRLVSKRIPEDRQMIGIFFKMFGADELSIQAPLANVLQFDANLFLGEVFCSDSFDCRSLVALACFRFDEFGDLRWPFVDIARLQVVGMVLAVG
jgi:hypothetical protein